MPINKASMKVHHIGYAVADLAKAKTIFKFLGYDIGENIIDEHRKVEIAFVKIGEENIELIAPFTADSPITSILHKSGASPYHICYKVDDIDEQLLLLRKNGWVIVQKPMVAPAINNMKAAFLYNKDIGLIELVEA